MRLSWRGTERSVPATVRGAGVGPGGVVPSVGRVSRLAGSVACDEPDKPGRRRGRSNGQPSPGTRLGPPKWGEAARPNGRLGSRTTGDARPTSSSCPEEDTMRINPFSRRLLPTLFVTLALGTAPVAAVTSTSSATTPTSTTAATCATPWGSLAKQRNSWSTEQIVNVRSGRHACFDRLVVDIDDPGPGTPGFDVRYVTRVTQDGSGATVPLRGGARLRLIVRAPAYDEDGPTYEGRQLGRAGRRHRLPDVPSGRLGGVVRGTDDDRDRSPGQVAHARARAAGCGRHRSPGHR